MCIYIHQLQLLCRRRYTPVLYNIMMGFKYLVVFGGRFQSVYLRMLARLFPFVFLFFPLSGVGDLLLFPVCL